MEEKFEDQFQRRVLKVSEPDMTLRGQSKVQKFVSGCTCPPETKQTKEAYNALASKLEELQQQYKSLLNKGSSSSQELARYRTEIGKLLKAQDDIKPQIAESKCRCWAEEAYEIWDEPGVAYLDNEDALNLPYRESKGVKFYLDENGYFYFDEKGKVNRLPLGYGVYYRDPYYQPLRLCSWHGTLVPEQKNEIARRMPREGERVVMSFANPVEYLDITGKSEKYEGEKKTWLSPTGELREYLIVNSEGPSATYGVYVYIRYGNKIDVACYDNCYAQSMEGVISEINFNDDKVRRLRSFIKEVVPIHEGVSKSYESFHKFTDRIDENGASLRKVSALLANLNANNLGREVEVARQSMERAKENLEKAREEAEASWLKRVLKVKNTKTMLEASKAALKGTVLKTFEELMAMEQPAEDAPEMTIRLFNSVIDYENFDLDVAECLIDENKIANKDKREKLKADVMDLHIKIMLKQKVVLTYDFEKILAREPSEEDSVMEKKLLDLIEIYKAQVEEKDAESTKEQILTLYGDIEQEKGKNRLLEEILARDPPAEDDSALQKELYSRIQAYKIQVENKEERSAEQILALYAEIEEEEEEDRLFEENLRNTLLNVPVEMDTSKEAQTRYVDTMCSAMKTAYTNATSAHKVKENIHRNEEAKRPELERSQESLTSTMAQDNTNMYRTIKTAHFPGKWFLEQAREFLDLRAGERFSLDEEETTEVLSPTKLKWKQETQNKQFDGIKSKITERCNNVASLVEETQRLLTKYKDLWPESKVIADYNAYVRLQKEFSMTRVERDQLKEAATALAAAKGIITRKVGTMVRAEEEEEEEEEKKEVVIIRPVNAPSSGVRFTRPEIKPSSVLTWNQRYDQAQRLSKVGNIKAPMAGPVESKVSSPVVLPPPFIKLTTSEVVPPFVKLAPSAPVPAVAPSAVPAEGSSVTPKSSFTPSRVRPSTPTVLFEVPNMPIDTSGGKAFTPSKVKARAGVTSYHIPVPSPSPKAKSPVPGSRAPLKATLPVVKAMSGSNLENFPVLPPIKPMAKVPSRTTQTSPKPVSPALAAVVEGFKPAKKKPIPEPEAPVSPTLATVFEESKLETKEPVPASKPRLTLKKTAPLTKPPVEPKTTPVAAPQPEVKEPEPEVKPKPKPKPTIPPKPKSSIKPRPSNVFMSLGEVEEEAD